jgi:hypothetical protein
MNSTMPPVVRFPESRWRSDQRGSSHDNGYAAILPRHLRPVMDRELFRRLLVVAAETTDEPQYRFEGVGGPSCIKILVRRA